jgi:hypothetical protein
MSVMSERDVLHEGLRELASELDAIETLIPEDLEEVSLRLQKARLDIDLTLEEANGHRSHPTAFSIVPTRGRSDRGVEEVLAERIP